MVNKRDKKSDVIIKAV